MANRNENEELDEIRDASEVPFPDRIALTVLAIRDSSILGANFYIIDGKLEFDTELVRLAREQFPKAQSKTDA